MRFSKQFPILSKCSKISNTYGTGYTCNSIKQTCMDKIVIKEELIKLRQKIADISFICKDKEIHFGAVHVVYVRDAMEEITNLITKLNLDKEVKS